tara:strand:+ start:419 stop:694 length:276 start_codon:yes stop_codon:yes gene_type:complete
MDPEATLKNILDLFDAVSNSDLDERDLGEDLWDLKYAVSDYSDWIKKDGFSPNFQNVVKEWLTKKQDEVKNSPDKKQKQLWDDSALGRFDL